MVLIIPCVEVRAPRMWSDEYPEPAGAGERWAPVGAVSNPEPDEEEQKRSRAPDMAVRLRLLEEEQEQLNSSLLALTSHFAQVQFRLKQIVHGPSAQQDREKMLHELEEFAFKGCPHVLGCRPESSHNPVKNSIRTRYT